jgi:outer membrane murein-binding lipoprotein Lpp
MKKAIVALVVLAGTVAGCGHTDEEFQAKVQERDKILADLHAQQAANAQLEQQIEQARAANPRRAP